MKLHTTLKGLAFILMTVPLFSYGQLKCPPIGKQNNKGKINITLGVGPTLLYGDIQAERRLGIAGVLKGDYQVYKGLFAGIEGQLGILNAYGKNYDVDDRPIDYDNRDPRFVKNYYFSGSLNLSVYPMLFFVDETRDFRKPSVPTLIARGLYAGIGFGGIVNHYDKLYRDPSNANTQAEFEPDANGDLTRYKTPTKDALWPIVNVGLSMPINKYTTTSYGYWSVVLNTQFNMAKGDQLDAYVPYLGIDRTSKADAYNFTYLGLKYTF